MALPLRAAVHSFQVPQPPQVIQGLLHQLQAGIQLHRQAGGLHHSLFFDEFHHLL